MELLIHGVRITEHNIFNLTTRSQHQTLFYACILQGSILGPLLYIIYVIDINSSWGVNKLSFADDTALYMSDSTLGKLYSDENLQINNLFESFCAEQNIIECY